MVWEVAVDVEEARDQPDEGQLVADTEHFADLDMPVGAPGTPGDFGRARMAVVDLELAGRPVWAGSQV